jgi:uncharacterized protein (DUF3820 family)
MKHGRAVIPFGKYKGVAVRHLPDAYLSWIIDSDVVRLPEWRWLRDSMVKELKARGLKHERANQPDEPEADPEPPRARRKFRFEGGSHEPN